jgi:hypothetical protein
MDVLLVSQAFLGVDPSVRIDYVGPKTVAGSVGLFSRYVASTFFVSLFFSFLLTPSVHKSLFGSPH